MIQLIDLFGRYSYVRCTKDGRVQAKDPGASKWYMARGWRGKRVDFEKETVRGVEAKLLTRLKQSDWCMEARIVSEDKPG